MPETLATVSAGISRCRLCGLAWPVTYDACPNDGAPCEPQPRRARGTERSDLAWGTRVGEYEIVDRLGEGGMGVVYAAVHPVIGKRVAIKVINPKLGDDAEAIDRFAREARMVCAIQHPGIVDVFGFGRIADG